MKEVKVQQLCSFSIYKPKILISSCSSDSVQCRRDLHFLAWALYLSFGTGYDDIVNC